MRNNAISFLENLRLGRIAGVVVCETLLEFADASDRFPDIFGGAKHLPLRVRDSNVPPFGFDPSGADSNASTWVERLVQSRTGIAVEIGRSPSPTVHDLDRGPTAELRCTDELLFINDWFWL